MWVEDRVGYVGDAGGGRYVWFTRRRRVGVHKGDEVQYVDPCQPNRVCTSRVMGVQGEWVGWDRVPVGRVMVGREGDEGEGDIVPIGLVKG